MKLRHSSRATTFGVATRLKHKARKTAQICLAAFETLEGRTLLSTAQGVTLSNGVLTITGNATTGSSLTANLVNSGKSIDASADDAHAMTVPLSSVKSIVITGGSGGDYIFVDQGITLPVTISGGAGNDSVRGGGGSNTITEGDGNVWVNGRGATNHITVGNGNDTVLGGGNVDTITAGSGNDSLDGSAGNDSITSGNGNDSITGDSGNDTIVAGNGKDVINGGLGNDNLTVGTGASQVIPGSGTNYIVLGSSLATVVPGAGTNTIVRKTPTTTTSTNTSTGTTTPAKSTGSTSTSNTSSGGTTTTGTTLTTGSTSWITYSAPPATGTAPRAIMQILAPAPTVNIAIDTRALNSTLGYGSPIDANFQWNFGDPNGQYNTLPGFNATHIYTTPGTYTITLTVTNGIYQASTVSAKITIGADTRRLIYVNSATGSDNNNGSTPGSAVQSAAKADSMVGNNTEVLFDRGETFNLAAAFKLNFTNVLVGAYGSGALPIINYTVPATGSVIFTTNSHVAAGVTIEDLTLTTLDGKDPTIANQPMGVMAGGFDTSVIGCTFDYVEYDVDASAAPVGLTVEGNQSPIDGGLEGYFVWDQGTDTSVIGNYVNSSVHEHVMRTSSATEILAYENNFSNFDGKGGIEIHVGAYAWIDSNTMYSGDIRVGPLGLWGEPVTDTTSFCVIQNNHVNNTDIQVYPGAHDISIRNNIITRPSSELIDVIGQDSYGRQSADIRILDNTGFLTGTTGNFVKIESHTLDVLLENNLLIQPTLTVGGFTTAPVYVVDSNLSDFDYINGNVWQEPGTFDGYANGGINYFGLTSTTAGYQTPAEWNAWSEVGTDYFSSTAITSNDAPDAGSLASSAATAIPGVFADIYGTARAQSGKWAAGAV
jgi:PKD domain/RTX calcium-binding nonapeptide repeat (4 copies)